MMSTPDSRALAAALVGLLIAGTLGIVLGERIPVNGGMGWDGLYYAEIARNFPDLGEAAVSAYRLQRILPPVVVGALLWALQIAPSDPAILLGFTLLNFLAHAATCVAWWKIARHLGISAAGFAIGVAGLFANFAVLRQSSYLPVTVDSAALAVGTLQLLWYLADRPRSLALVTAAGGFVWQLALPVGLALLLLRRGVARPAEVGRSWAILAAAAVTVLYLVRFLRLHLGGIHVVGAGPVVPVQQPWLALSLLVCLTYLAAIVVSLLRGYGPRDVPAALRSIRPRRVVFAMGAVLLPALVVRIVHGGRGPGDEMTLAQFSSFLAVLPVTRPGVFLVAHVAYFGPVLLLAVAAWRTVAAAIRSEGAGLVVVMLGGALVALSSESRQSIIFLPFVVAYTSLALDQLGLARPLAPATLLLGLLTSRFWLPLDHVTEAQLPDRWLTPQELAYHFNGYFANHGPWMTNGWYLVHLATAVAAGAALWLVARRARLHRGSTDGSESREQDHIGREAARAVTLNA